MKEGGKMNVTVERPKQHYFSEMIRVMSHVDGIYP